ncbi:hypothetical protein [Paenibacillus sp. YN15]|uniref:hypothetical protein n=1 Tax=Paenibacillus sp. YN15 TaxID=1742774 RepID=UPI000DCD46C1|nr:hypothetical protein [Paenibacillus sp. YN15]RAV04188.1 hypothetical protein DQG13_06845 [Paenibacillus sp. YN15]
MGVNSSSPSEADAAEGGVSGLTLGAACSLTDVSPAQVAGCLPVAVFSGVRSRMGSLFLLGGARLRPPWGGDQAD